MAKAERLPSGNWRVRVQWYDDEGKRHHKSVLGKTEAEALYLAEKEKAKGLNFSKPEKRDSTLLDMCNAYIQENQRSLSPTTLTNYAQICRNYFPKLFQARFSLLNNRMLQKAIDDDTTHSPKSIYNAVGFISAVIRAYNPDFVVSVKLPKRKRDIRPIPTLEEVGIILNAVESSDIDIPISLAVYLGMRMSEILGLRFEDIRRGRAYIHGAIVRTAEGVVYKDYTKNITSTRVVALPPVLLAKIQALNGAPGEHIVRLTHSQIEKRFTKLLINEQLPHYRFHDLRHANASIMLRLNIPTKYQMARGGWATDSTLKTVYQHTMADYETEIDSQIYSFIDGLKAECDT